MRLDRARERLDREICAILIAPGDDLRYLTGWSPTADERLTFLLASPDGAALVVPAVNAEEAAAHLPEEVPIFRFSDEVGPAAALAEAWSAVRGRFFRPLISDDARFDHVRLASALPLAEPPGLASEILAPLRMKKDEEELRRLKASQAINDRAMAAAYEAMASGMTEAELAEAIRRAFMRHGADRVAFIIVAAGEHSAHPHHTPGDRVLEPGPVLLDIGCYKDGYASDMTRVAWLGEPSERFRQVHAVVDQAVAAGKAAAFAGQPAQAVDLAARTVIDQAGFGPYFVHRTGHGIGLSVHEPPSIMAGNSLGLEPGMAFSIEPGIYLPGEFGVRLEEVAVIGDGPSRFLSELSREIWIKPI
ncbi:MAG: Xaa-Pro peptidase family protein [Thermaerobacter sp.]|nr:Xaa-Pro peptidase family protein [Thermaerobacter sp.]